MNWYTIERIKSGCRELWEVRIPKEPPITFYTEQEAKEYIAKRKLCGCCGQPLPNKIRMGAKYQTRGGEAVRLYAVEDKGQFPVHGAIFDECWKAWEWKADGKATDGGRDLIEISEPPKAGREGDGL